MARWRRWDHAQQRSGEAPHRGHLGPGAVLMRPGSGYISCGRTSGCAWAAGHRAAAGHRPGHAGRVHPARGKRHLARLLVGAALAPTDAALGAAVMVNRAVPARIQRLINVESGLNDGIATPFVLVAIAGAATAEHAASTGPGAAVAELALGLLIGIAVGGGGGWLVKVARGRGWVAEGFAGAAVLGLALSPTPPPWPCTATGSSPRSPAAWPSPPRRPGRQAGALRRRDRRCAVAAGLADVRGGRGGPGPE